MIDKFRRTISKLFLVIFFFTLKVIVAQESTDQGFADYLFNEGEYYRAITEYYRLLYNENDTSRKISLLKKIGLSYYNGRSYDEYISFINKNRSHFQSHTFILNEIDFYVGKSYYLLGQYPKAITTLEWTITRPEQPFYNDTQFLLGICYARIFDWQAAEKKLQLIESQSSFRKFADHFSQAKDDVNNLSHKKSVLAGCLSTIIPGAGYIYCNRIGTGVTSLIVNGLLVWTMHDALIHRQYGLAATTGFFGIGWYVGNIKGSITAAEIYNTKIRNEFIDHLLEQADLTEYIDQHSHQQ